MMDKNYTEYSGLGRSGGKYMEQTSPIEVMTAYLLLKVKQKDWHGVADAANDIRVMEAEAQKDGDRA